MTPSETGPEPVEEAVRIFSDGLALEGRLAYPAEARNAIQAVLLLCPHPFLGGDMNGNVTKDLRETLVARGRMVLSFNYRGIGTSQTDRDLEVYREEFWRKSCCPEYEEKIFADAAFAFDYLCKAAGAEPPFDVVGYSFGCLPALKLASENPSRVRRIGLISPPLAKWAFAPEYVRVRAPAAFFYSPGDFACPEDRIETAYAAFEGAKTLKRFDGCSHFYVGRERELAEAVAEFLELGTPGNQVGKMCEKNSDRLATPAF